MEPTESPLKADAPEIAASDGAILPPIPRKRPRWDRFTRIRRSRTIKRIVWTGQQLGKLAILGTIAQYFIETGARQKSKEFQAWQILNSAQGGDGGRTLALHDLIDDGVDLSGIEFNAANLRRFDFSGAKLDEALFAGTRLDDSNFFCWPHSWAYRLLHFRQHCETSLENATFFTTLKNVIFDGVQAPGITFVGRNQVGAFSGDHDMVGRDELSGNQDRIEGVSFDNAILNHAYFINTNIHWVNFHHTELRGVTFQNVILGAVDFRGAFLDNGTEEPTTFSSVLFSFANFDSVSLKNVVFKDARVSKKTIPQDMKPGSCATSAGCPLLVDKAEFPPLTEQDLKGARLCNTSINGTISNRDCSNKIPPGTENEQLSGIISAPLVKRSGPAKTVSDGVFQSPTNELIPAKPRQFSPGLPEPDGPIGYPIQ